MIAYVTTAETDLLALAAARERLARAGVPVPPVRAHNLTEAGEAALAEVDAALAAARVVVLSLLGGKKAHPAVFERVTAHCRRTGVPLLAWSGEPEPDPELTRASSLPPPELETFAAYARYGGAANFAELLRRLSDRFLGTTCGFAPPRAEPWEGIWWPGTDAPLDAAGWRAAVRAAGLDPAGPVAVVFFYRAHWLAGNLDFVAALAEALQERGLVPLPVFAPTLRADGAEPLPRLVREAAEDRLAVAVVTMSFAVAGPGGPPRGTVGRPTGRRAAGWLEALDVPVLQAVVSLAPRRRWAENGLGLSPVETAMSVAVPEFDGRVVTVPVAFRQEVPQAADGIPARRYEPDPDRIAVLADQAAGWARLRTKPPAARRVAILLTNYPARNSRVGNAVGLDTPASAVRLLRALAEAGYDVGPADALPADGDELMHRLIAAGTHDTEWTMETAARDLGRWGVADYAACHDRWPAAARENLRRRWGPPPGAVGVLDGRFVIPGLTFGHVFVGIQPPRAPDDDPVHTYHSPEIPPPHQYLAYYRWLRDGFGADAVVHLGKHGTLEWLPGKSVGLSNACFPELALPDLPNLYPFVVDDPGEGTQAKRRSHAVIVDHLVPPVQAAGLYDDLAELQQLLDQYYQARVLDPTKLDALADAIWEVVERAELKRDLGRTTRPEDFDRFLQDVDGYLCELEAAQIRDGLHVLGQPPADPAARRELLFGFVRLAGPHGPGLPEVVARALGVDWAACADDLGAPWTGPLPPGLTGATSVTRGDVRGEIERRCRALLDAVVGGTDPDPALAAHPEVAAVLDTVRTDLLPRLLQAEDEIRHLVRALGGGFVPPGPSGAPTRGMTDVLPTGRNFYSVDPRGLPSRPAWAVGRRLAEELVERYRQAEGREPETVAIVVWGTAAMRTGGDDVAEILALLGVRPVWQPESHRVVDLEVIPLEELGRPRVDVTVRISGFFRDAFHNLVALVQTAVERVAALDEPLALNPVRRHVLEDELWARQAGRDAETARRLARYRVFGSPPGAYGSGILPVLHSGRWEGRDDLAAVYLRWSAWAYTGTEFGVAAEDVFRRRLAQVQVATKNQDNREHDIFDSDDYLQDHGGLAATIASLTGRRPALYFGDSADPARPRVRTFEEEARRVVRSRVTNPRWIRSVMRHGYKGALEMANTVDFLFGYDATADLVEDWMYDRVARAYALDPEVQAFFRRSNPWALRDIAERLLEARARGLWEDADPAVAAALEDLLEDIEGTIEGWHDPGEA
ncbi:MAG: cobaltochelatase subunit CobN [Actinomycetia bacterium]|nr:cobaltochelatase subunit CobN [Actinomycetes bacterium]